MRRGVIELVVVIAAVGVLGWLSQRPDRLTEQSSHVGEIETPNASRTPHTVRHYPRNTVTSHGIRPGMTADAVHALLGAPPKSGTLNVKGGQGRWEEYGTAAGSGCTWEGHPTITYYPDGTVLCVLGTSVEVAGKGEMKDDDLTSANARSLLGAEPDPINPLSYRYHGPLLDLNLVVFPSGRKHVAFSSSPAALTTPSPHYFSTSTAPSPRIELPSTR